MNVINSAERVREAAQEKSAREAAGKAATEARQTAADRDAARRDAERARLAAEFGAAKQTAEEAFSVGADALQRVDRIVAVAQGLLNDHSRDHAARRDVAETALDDLLAQVGPELERRGAAFARRLAGAGQPPTVGEALELAELAERARDAEATADGLRALLEHGAFSALSTAEYQEVRAQARTHFETIRRTRQTAHEAAGAIGAALRRIDGGESADAATPAAQILDVEKLVQAQLRVLRELLYPANTTTGATA